MANDTLILTSVSTGVIFLLTATVVTLRIKAFFVRKRNVNGLLDYPDLYTCDDGRASEESELQYRSAIKKCVTAAFLIALVGFSVVLVDAIIQSLPPLSFHDQSTTVEAWLRTVNWVLILLLTVCVAFAQPPNDVYRAAICGAFNAFIISVLSVVHVLALSFYYSLSFQCNSESSPRTFGTLQLGLSITESVAGLAVLISFLSLPRRPELYTETGRVVDREHNVSAICRYSLHWCYSILSLGTAKETVHLDDLPSPAYAVRAKTAHQRFLSSNYGGPLWRCILLTNLTAFSLQWSLTLLQSAMQFVPQLSMYNLLRQLELRQAGDETPNFSLIVWCIALSIGLLLNEWVQSWLYWIVFAQIAAPIRAQLAALIFAKALRRKNTKALGKGGSPREINADASSGGSSKGSSLESSASDDSVDDDAAAKKFTQATINLVGVDATRVADFCSLNCLLVNSIFKICISIAFLIYLIGFRALFAGVLSFALTTPLTTFITKRYSVAQKTLMALRDEKLGVVTEVLQGIRGIKFAAAESAWEQKIILVRNRELGVLWRIFVSATLLEFVGLLGPLLLSTVSLAVYVYFNMQLTPSIAFTTLAVFSSLEATVGLLPVSIAELVEAKVGTDRIHDYLQASEKKQNVSHAEEISFKDASVAWPSENHDEANHGDNQFVLSRVNIDFPRGELTLISGKTGAGKSLLLASLIGESELLAGLIKMPRTRDWSTRHDNAATHGIWLVPGSVAFVAQVPWIENMSIKENILFTLPMDQSRYETALWACSLEHDLELLPDGDETEIGANGINLSGGQRWRVALARALYSRAEILVLDDVFSAVDAHVGAWILEKALMGPLAHGRTRILATHHISLVSPKASYTVSLSNGTVTTAGRIVEDLIELSERRSPYEGDDQNVKSSVLKTDTAETEPGQIIPMVNIESMTGVRGNKGKMTVNAKPQAFIQEEQRKTGAISAQIFQTYFEASGGLSLWAVCLLGFFAARFIVFGRSWWIKVWTSSYPTESFAHKLPRALHNNNSLAHQASEPFLSSELGNIKNDDSTRYYLLIYFVLSIASCLANTLKELYISTLVIKGSRNLFAKMAHTILRMPLRWIDTVPVGRILNRFTADFNSLDSRMAHDLGSMISSVVQVAVIIVAGFLISPLVVILGVILLGFAVLVGRRYLRAARVVKRLDSVTKSPVFEQFGSALIGLSTIRAFGYTQAYMEKMYGLIDGYTVTSWNLWLFNRWLSFNLGLIGVVANIAVVILIVSMKSIDAALAGLALSFTLEFSVALNWTLRRYANVELIMNAVERVHEYTDLTTEPSDGIGVPAAWPSEGRLLVSDLVVGYDEDSPPVLKGVTFEAPANRRIGIVGRTGAGKSSLMLALFRFLEPRSGSITIDGIDISKIKLYDLRSRLSIIPQDPGLFAGTIRSNLDPLNIHDDIKLHEALHRAHLTQTPGPITNQGSHNTPSSSSNSTPPLPNTNIFSILSSPIGEGGFNLSQGQRQLLCLARALLSQPKLMILDEATSAVDMQTDTLIQRTLREEFANTTLIVIAHRLSTVADFDRILVLSDGVVVEYGEPGELLDRRGAYWRMVGESGEQEVAGEGGGGRVDG